MATVYLANTAGEAGFSRLVAVKVLHPHLAEQEDFVAMLLDEARLAARIHHPNVVAVVDLQTDGLQHYIVMDYVEGCSLNELLRKNRGKVPPSVVVRIVLDSLNGLHAAHTLTDANGAPLNLIHRDVTPQNILVGVDGTARLTDFGVALAQSRIHHTRQRELKGKISFMAPEQIRCLPLDHRADIFSVGCLMWLSLTGKSLFLGASDAVTLSNVLNTTIVPPSTVNAESPAVLDAVCVRALEREASRRWSTAAEMEESLREIAQPYGLVASRKEVSEWVKKTCHQELDERRVAVRDVSSARIEPSKLAKPRMVVPVLSQAQLEPSSAANSPTEHHEVPTSPINLRVPFWSRSRLLWLTAIAAVSSGALIASFASKKHSGTHSETTTSSPPPVPAQRPTEILSPPSAVPAEPDEPAAKPIVKNSPPEPPAPLAKVEDSVGTPGPSASAGRKLRPALARKSAVKSAAISSPSPPSQSPSQPSPPRPTTPTWDKDSPLPPL